MVKLVDAEANERRTHDPTLEVNNNAKQLQTNTHSRSDPNNSTYVSQPQDPNDKTKPAYKKNVPTVTTNHCISACLKKQRDDEDKQESYARSKHPQTSCVVYFCSPSNGRTNRTDNRYRNRITSNIICNNKNKISQNRSRDRYSYDNNITLPQKTRSRYGNQKTHFRLSRSP